jgi:hypothetical protein
MPRYLSPEAGGADSPRSALLSGASRAKSRPRLLASWGGAAGEHGNVRIRRKGDMWALNEGAGFDPKPVF